MIDLNTIREIKINDFDYPLPDQRIPRHPLADRASCKLLLLRPDGKSGDFIFSDLPGLLPIGGMMVCNSTRVINARMKFQKSTGAQIEIFLLEPINPADYAQCFQSKECCSWNCLVGNLKRWKGEDLTKQLEIEGETVILRASLGEPLPGNAHCITFSWDNPSFTWADIVEKAGKIPIPPYLRRETEKSDNENYQTVYSRQEGSVAAPTAGLHFTQHLLDDIAAHNTEIRNVTLHVGAGTFQPVKSEEIGDHPMHTETFSIDRDLVTSLIDCLKQHRPVTAVGTTSVRTLESLPYLGFNLQQGRTPHVGQWDAYIDAIPEDEEQRRQQTIKRLQAIIDEMDRLRADSLTAGTSIMIAPGFKWRIVDVLVTNFHQPKSTLLLLVSSFIESNSPAHPGWRDLYTHALEADYRFLSYGDACLLFRQNSQV